MTAGRAEAAPDWFQVALASRPDHRAVDVLGVRIAYRVWGAASLPGVVLVHGGAAHAGWWDHVAPRLEGHRVVALDLSGHGDSGRRTAYRLSAWAEEVHAAAATEGLTRPVIIGHSLGGWVSLAAATDRPGSAAAVALIDSLPQDQPPDEQRLAARRRPHRRYGSLEEALGAFRPIPEQDEVLPFVAEHVAGQSLRKDGDAWTWKFDPRVFAASPALRPQLAKLAVPGLIVRPEHGLLSARTAQDLSLIPVRALEVAEIAGSGHAPMMDRPLLLAEALNGWLGRRSAGWRPGAAPGPPAA